jgi:hypothetical protein
LSPQVSPSSIKEQSPGMALLSKQVSHLADVSAVSSRRLLLTASPSEFGDNTMKQQ